MKVERLREEALKAVLNTNYQHKSVSQEDRQVLAVKSFLSIKESQQESALQHWAFVNGHKTVPEKSTDAFKAIFDEVCWLRYLCQTNLFFLCKVLEYSLVTDKKYVWTDGKVHNTHEEICNSFFVAKDPATYPTFQAFAHAYMDEVKERLLLVPRGGFKSSINMADCVQWIICWPEVTIGILTGKLGLASDFVGEVKAHFTLDENLKSSGKTGKYVPREVKDAFTGERSTSMFQVLFPEHCVEPNDGKQTEFQTPAISGGDKEPTVRANGIEQGLSGSHFGILKLDDVITEENSNSVTRMEALNHRIGVDKALMHPYGFYDVIGTWYDERDYYGVQIKYEDQLAQQGETHTMLIYRRAVWWPTPEAVNKVEASWTAEDVHMWFPDRLDFKKMKAESLKDPEGFAIKYLNDPRKINKIKFPRELLISRTLTHNALPHKGMIVTAVDTAYSTKSWADYTVILTGLIFGGIFYILNMVRGRYNEMELPGVIAHTLYKWKPKKLVIEDSVGVKWMGRELKREMDKLQISVPVQYASLGVGSKQNSKSMKARPVARLLGDQRLYFVNSCEGLEELYTELSQFTGTVDDKHDDIVSAISLLVEYFQPYADMTAKVQAAETAFIADDQNFEMHQMIYGIGKYASTADDNPTTTYQVEHAAQNIPSSDYDPLSDVMPGDGGRTLRDVF